MRKEDIKIEASRAGEIVTEYFEYQELDTDDTDEQVVIDLMISAHSHLKKAVMRGRLEFNYDGGKVAVIQHLRYPFEDGLSSLTYGMLNGKAKVAMKKAKPEDIAGRQQLMMGALCGKGAGLIGKLEGTDYALMESLAAIFFIV